MQWPKDRGFAAVVIGFQMCSTWNGLIWGDRRGGAGGTGAVGLEVPLCPSNMRGGGKGIAEIGDRTERGIWALKAQHPGSREGRRMPVRRT